MATDFRGTGFMRGMVGNALTSYKAIVNAKRVVVFTIIVRGFFDSCVPASKTYIHH